jgi:hypothetical protein
VSIAPDHVLRRGDVIWRSVLDGVLVRRPRSVAGTAGDEAEVVRLSGSGVALWHALAAPVTHAELCAELARDHGVDVATVAADLQPVLDDLLGRGLVVRDGRGRERG